MVDRLPDCKGTPSVLVKALALVPGWTLELWVPVVALPADCGLWVAVWVPVALVAVKDMSLIVA